MFRPVSALFLPPSRPLSSTLGVAQPRNPPKCVRGRVRCDPYPPRCNRDAVCRCFRHPCSMRPIRCNETIEHARRHKFGQSSRLISPAGGRSAGTVRNRHEVPCLCPFIHSLPPPPFLFLRSVSSRSAGFMPGAVTCPQLTANGEQDRLEMAETGGEWYDETERKSQIPALAT